MGRLQFDLKPLSREGGRWETREENDAWVRECWTQWGRGGEPGPCDCGYWGDGWLVTCDDRQRVVCKARMPGSLEGHYRHDHLQALKKKRVFPGPAHDGKGMGYCRWCGAEIIEPKTGERSKRRTWCISGDCLHAYNLHTRLPVQQDYLVDRDGMGCKDCGLIAGRWSHMGGASSPDIWRSWGPKYEKRYPRDLWVGPVTMVSWQTRLEVDHFIALAVAWLAFPDAGRRRWFFGPPNLRLLCTECHKAKTQRDRILLRDIAQRGPGWAKDEVLRHLARAGLIRVARPRGKL